MKTWEMGIKDISGLYVFISYSHVDSHTAEQIASDLRDLSIDYFLDRKDIDWGQSISENVRKALRECTHQIIILTPASIRSAWVHFEVGHAIGSGKVALPYLTHPSLDIPQYLTDLLWIGSREDLRAYFANERVPTPRPSMGAVELANWASTLANQARYHEAVRYAMWAIEADQQYEFGYRNAIDILRWLGRYEDALKTADKGLAKVGRIPVLLNQKAFVLRSMARFREAMELFQEALHIDDTYTEANYWLADCLRQQKQIERAIVEYNRVMELAPSMSRFHKWARQQVAILQQQPQQTPEPDK